MTPPPSRGEVWLVDPKPARGHEQAGSRPALVVSTDAFNYGPAELAIVIPMTTRDERNPLHVRVESSESGLRAPSFVKCEDVRSVSRERLSQRVGRVLPATIADVEDRLRVLLEL